MPRLIQPPCKAAQAETLCQLRQAIESGDWELARSAAEQLAGEPVAPDKQLLEERLEQLGHVLNAARASRAQLAASLSRVRAATRFQAAAPRVMRQNLVEPIDF